MEENIQNKENEISTGSNLNSNKNGIIAILIILIIALIGAVVYFAFIKKDEDSSDNGKDNSGGNKQQEVSDDSSKFVDNTDYKIVNFDNYINELKSNETVKDVKYEFHDVTSSYDFEELDGMIDGNVLIKKSEDGKISLKYSNNNIITISNLPKVKDYVSVLYGNYIYFITDNGEVYKYMTEDTEGKAVRLTKISNADKFVYVSYSLKDELYISTDLGIIDSNNNYIRLLDVTGL